jgi:hypothetical protein
MLNMAQLAAIAKGAITINTRQSIIQSPLQLLIYLKGLLMPNQIYLYSNVPVLLTFYPDFFEPLGLSQRKRGLRIPIELKLLCKTAKQFI